MLSILVYCNVNLYWWKQLLFPLLKPYVLFLFVAFCITPMSYLNVYVYMCVYLYVCMKNDIENMIMETFFCKNIWWKYKILFYFLCQLLSIQNLLLQKLDLPPTTHTHFEGYRSCYNTRLVLHNFPNIIRILAPALKYDWCVHWIKLSLEMPLLK